MRVHFRVTGHLHVRGLRYTPAGVHLAAGAVSPERDPEHGFTSPASPAMSLSASARSRSKEASHFEIFLRGRLWSDSDGWQPDPDPSGSIGRRYRLGIPESGEDIPIEPVVQAAEISRPRLELRYRLARLQAYDRDQCAVRIDAPIDQIVQAPSHRQVAELFEWAEANERLDDLWAAVIAAAQVPSPPENPFS